MRMHKHILLPYFFVLAFATVFVQALMLGYDSAGMRGVFIGAAIAYVALGLFVGFVWSPRLLIVSVLAGIPTWLFVFALHQWSIITALMTIVEGVPLVLEPLSVSLFFSIGAWSGAKVSTLRKQRQTSTGQL